MRKMFFVILAVLVIVGLSASAFAQDVKNKHSNPQWSQASPPTYLGGGIVFVHGKINDNKGCRIQGKLFAPPNKQPERQVVETNCENAPDRNERVAKAENYIANLNVEALPLPCLDQNGKPANHCYVGEF